MRTRLIIAMLLVFVAVVAAIWWAFLPSRATPPERASDENTHGATPPSLREGTPPQRGGEKHGTIPPSLREGTPPQRGGEKRGTTPPERASEEEKHGTTPPSLREGTPSQRGGEKPSWQGPGEWIAPVDEAEEARIDKVFEEARAARFDPRLPDRSRAASIVAARQVVDRCFHALQERAPGVQGRLIVAWTAGARDGRGTITDPRIAVNYKLEDPAFEACVLDGLAGLTFRGSDGDPIAIEAPFFYDGSF